MCFIFHFENVKAICNDEELNEWATNVKVLFKEDNDISDDNKFAYFLSITPMRDDIKIQVTDGTGYKTDGKNYESAGIYGLGCYTNIDAETYIIEIYGNEKSSCNNELLKTLKYTVPPYNDYIKTDYCEKYPEHELCQTFTDATKNIDREEFNDILKEYAQDINGDKLTLSEVLLKILEYSIYILIPLIIITIIYFVKVKSIKKKEGNK